MGLSAFLLQFGKWVVFVGELRGLWLVNSLIVLLDPTFILGFSTPGGFEG